MVHSLILLPLLVLRNTHSCARRVRRLLSMSSRITLLAKLAISWVNTGTSIYGSNLLPVPYRECNRRQYPSRERRTPMALTTNCGDPFLMRQKRRNFGPAKILSPLVASTLRQERKAYFAGDGFEGGGMHSSHPTTFINALGWTGSSIPSGR